MRARPPSGRDATRGAYGTRPEFPAGVRPDSEVRGEPAVIARLAALGGALGCPPRAKARIRARVLAGLLTDDQPPITGSVTPGHAV